jgi:hypothetical protein
MHQSMMSIMLMISVKKNLHSSHFTTRNFVFYNLSYVTKKFHMQLFCMQHVQLHAIFFNCIREVAKDKISSSV